MDAVAQVFEAMLVIVVEDNLVEIVEWTTLTVVSCELSYCSRMCCIQLQEKGTKLVLEQIVTTLASVADTAEEKFEQYYDR